MKHHHDFVTVLRLFMRSDARRLLLGAGLSTLTVLAGIALLGVSGWFITATGLAGLSAAAALAFNVFVPSAGIRLLALGRTFGRYAERLVTHDATLGVLASLRVTLFRGWAEPQAARALLQRPGRLLFRLTGDIDALESVYLRLLVPLAATFGAALLAGLLLAILDWRLGACVFVWLLACGWGVAAWTAGRARPLALRRVQLTERLRAGAIDLSAGQTDLALAGRLPAQCAALQQTDARLARGDDALHRLETRAGWLHAVAGHATVALVLLAAGVLAGQGKLDAPLAALALLTALAALEPFAALRRGAIEAARSALAARRLAPRLRADAMQAQAAGHAEESEALRMDRVGVTHAGRAQPALHAIDLHIAAGERVAVIGASGAGKSTLLALAAGELAPQSGGVAAAPCTWLTQRTELFQDSLRDNLRLADPQACDAQLWAVLQAAGLAEDVRRLAQGLDTPLGEGGLGLSGGQSRRLALARLLLRDAGFWLLDEPTEGLDGATAADVLARLNRHAEGRTLLIATHLRREAALAERLLVMQGGRIVADLRCGTPDYDAALARLRQH
ncbi:ATP-binding cassette domain-containing protein [Massilia sp. IC2-278]|uniref:amino acid ABC transporter ATP-binding/permease protein n=1 Tax=Massilia sp. IC2-278 TaxID=2887200 RepID=UPI001E2C0204|nr:ATP-binding cassette domain-containing protein [Massilia sp. IC2-278]MCC2961511.1 ATP-binding cassette domain-containing protein [Massilia sp. IC2-278]